MTVLVEERKKTFTGAGTTGPFSWTFRFLSNEHIEVTLIVVATGGRTLLVETTDYVMTGARSYDGGSVTTVVAVAVGEELEVLRLTPRTQEVDLRNQGSFFPETYEEALDAAVMTMQDLKGDFDDLEASQEIEALEAAVQGAATAQGLSEDARDASVIAKGLSEDARDASVIAKGLSEDAQAAAEAAQAAAEAAVVPATETVAGIVELATPTEAAGGTDNSRAVTSEGVKAYVDGAFTKSHATNGYAINPDGTIKQWGTYTSTQDAAETFNLPMTFPTECFGVSLTRLVADESYAMHPSAFTTSQFTVDRNGSITGNQQFYIEATGY